MDDQDKIDALEKRLNFVTNTLINTQTELARVRQELDVLKGSSRSATPQPKPVKEKPVATPAPAATVAAPIPAVAAARTAPPVRRNLEAFIGGKLITLIGIIILVIGLGIFVKYAIEKDLIGPIGRVTLGLLAGTVLLGVAFRLREKYHGFSAVLLSGGMSVLYFSTFAAYDFYSLIPQAAAFAVMVVLTVFTVFAAIQYNLQIIGILGLVGAYGVPFLLSDNTGRVAVLFSYMAVVNGGILTIAFRKNWRLLNWVAFVMTWLIYATWYIDQYDPDRHLALGMIFGSAYFLMFYGMVTAYKLTRGEPFGPKDVVLICVNSFVYYGFGYAMVAQVAQGVYLGLFTLANACVHFGFSAYTFRKNLADRRFFYLEIGMVLTFLVLAVPVQLNGHWVTMIWSAGALVLFWIGRSQKVVFYERLAYALVILSAISLLQDWSEYYNSQEALLDSTVLFNMTFLTSLLVLGGMAGIRMISADENLIYDAVGNSRLAAVATAVLSALLFVLIYFAGANEVGAFWQKRFYLSAVTVDYTVYDSSMLMFQTVWLTNYTAAFLLGATLLVMRRWPRPVFRWIALSLNAVFFLYFATGFFEAVTDLQQAYLTPDETAVFRVGFSAIMIRYSTYALGFVLLYATGRLIRGWRAGLTKYFPTVVHALILITLSHELTTWLVLTHPAEAVDYETFAHKIGFTILWGVYALFLIALGIWRRSKPVRIMAIAVFTLTLLKLYLFDLGELSTGGKVIVFISLGVLLLIIAFLYQKFKTVMFGDDEVSD